jgi:hypothetical protein
LRGSKKETNELRLKESHCLELSSIAESKDEIKTVASGEEEAEAMLGNLGGYSTEADEDSVISRRSRKRSTGCQPSLPHLSHALRRKLLDRNEK